MIAGFLLLIFLEEPCLLFIEISKQGLLDKQTTVFL
jgi:hypothetical protein